MSELYVCPYCRGTSRRILLSIEEAQRAAGVCRRTIYSWMEQNKLEFIRTAGGSVRIFEDSLWRVRRMK